MGASRAGSRDSFDSVSKESPRFSFYFTLLPLTAIPMLPPPLCPVPAAGSSDREKILWEALGGAVDGEWRMRLVLGEVVFNRDAI